MPKIIAYRVQYCCFIFLEHPLHEANVIWSLSLEILEVSNTFQLSRAIREKIIKNRNTDNLLRQNFRMKESSIKYVENFGHISL